MNVIYLLTFDMLTPMMPRRNIPPSPQIKSDYLKLGISTNWRRRWEEYQQTYWCPRCEKSHVEIGSVWSVDDGSVEPTLAMSEIDRSVKRQFSLSRVYGTEFYIDRENLIYEQIIDFIDNELILHLSPEIELPMPILNEVEEGLGTIYKLNPNCDLSTLNPAHVTSWRINWLGSNGRSLAEILDPFSIYNFHFHPGSRGDARSELNLDIKMGRVEKLQSPY
ncbi:hypothetical protein OAL14_05785 [Gammaproteobacteria bacterium]|nr:hypothetical protein [Gammaproteobacteria bacterium]